MNSTNTYVWLKLEVILKINSTSEYMYEDSRRRNIGERATIVARVVSVSVGDVEPGEGAIQRRLRLHTVDKKY